MKLESTIKTYKNGKYSIDIETNEEKSWFDMNIYEEDNSIVFSCDNKEKAREIANIILQITNI